MRPIALALALALGFLCAPIAASADVPPPSACDVVDKPCNTAPPDYRSPGVCKKDRCSRATPSGVVSYDCNLCASVPRDKPKDKPKK
jgi:hypothetical protein